MAKELKKKENQNIKYNMAFKMVGMSFKGESPLDKTRNYSKLSKSIQDSKFGKSKLGKVVGSVTEKIGNVQEKFIDGKRKLGLNTSGYDATEESSNDNVMIIDGDASSSIEDTLPKTPMAKKAPTRNYKKGLGSYKSMKKIKKK